MQKEFIGSEFSLTQSSFHTCMHTHTCALIFLMDIHSLLTIPIPYSLMIHQFFKFSILVEHICFQTHADFLSFLCNYLQEVN